MLDNIRSLPEYQGILHKIRDGVGIPKFGLARATRLPVLSSLYSDLQMPFLLITDRAERALTLLDEIGFWSKNISRLMFPEPNPLFYEHAAWGTTTRRDRLLVLTMLAKYHVPGPNWKDTAPILVAPIRALMARTLPRREFLKASKTIRRGQILQPEVLVRNWVEIGYQSAEIVLEPGLFSRRGGIFDIWPPAEMCPIRLEFFGDEVDTLRCFDPATQRKIQDLDQILITPARELLPGRATGLNLNGNEIDEFYLPFVHPSPASLLDYLPKNSLILIDDMGSIRSAAMEIEEQAVKFRADSVKEGIIPEDYPIPYLSFSELTENFVAHQWVELGRSTATEDDEIAHLFTPGARYAGRLKPLMDSISEYCTSGDRVMIVSRQISRLKEIWSEHQTILKIDKEPEFIDGTLSEGFDLSLSDGTFIHLLTDSEIFGYERSKPRQPRRQTVEAPEAVFADLTAGSWVVHIDYGVGRYIGLVQRTVDKTEREFLCIEYEDGAQLFVPVHQADRLSRYIGPEGETPKATRLGTVEWTHAKQRVRQAVQEIAKELLDLYAIRQFAQGYAFSSDTGWQKELEASFPYIETDDQLRAIQEVKRDMESIKPMDRLLCGDVGYGKTEVALRAAFKAVMDGKQVAILVPTTVLAQQHYDTFRQRLAPFPVTVEMLSRFRSHKEQEEIVRQVLLGTVDIVIGTHRLLQQDVKFKDLGLVIVDEEQRFGVTHKEHFKKLRTELDVLTLTATPIPRTLYMALTGVRDISTINTPPEERLSIITHIGPYSPRLVRQAILRELERGGQVFFVHNRVQTIGGMERHLNKLIPESRVGVAHGQMPEANLAEVMVHFNKGDIDVLLCTSIIESGLDIPNANTLIVDRGDTFGLTQLYQLRGRVGRGAQRAYAYFFRHTRKAPTPEGAERLEVIADNAQLGAGYTIAMRDLEMRGAGELLGTRQSGYIADVGFYLYTRLLAQAVRDLRQSQGLSVATQNLLDIKDSRIPVSVDLPLSIGIPMDYVADQNQRLRLYRRLANIENEEDIQPMMEEFKDRFGQIPDTFIDLLYQIRVKLRAERAGLISVGLEADQVVMRYPSLPEGITSRNLPNLPGLRAGKNAYWLTVEDTNQEWKERLLQVLELIPKA